MTQNQVFQYPRARLDALSDGIYSVAMTLLVLDIRLPEDFHPSSESDLISGFHQLWPKFLTYLLSFFVLGLRWLANVKARGQAETVNSRYVRWWLLNLLLVTCVPFTAIWSDAMQALPRRSGYIAAIPQCWPSHLGACWRLRPTRATTIIGMRAKLA